MSLALTTTGSDLIPYLNDDIRNYISTHRYFEKTIKRHTDAFGSYDSFLAFLRRHQQRLLDQRLYLPRQGSAGSLVHVQIAEAITRILVEESRSHSLNTSDSGDVRSDGCASVEVSDV